MTATLAADYTVLLATSDLTFSFDCFHSDSWNSDVGNRPKQRAYDVLNGSILIELGSGKKYLVLVWGNNLTNSAFTSQLNAANVGDVITVVQGRTYGVIAGVRF